MTLAHWARWLLWANAAASAASILFAWRRGFDPFSIGDSETLYGLAASALLFATAILVLIWLYRANAGARALGAEDMMVSPGWAVAWFFVPLANLVMPFIAMRELWKASANPRDWQLASAPLAIPLWWAFWLASGLAGGVAVVLALQPEMDALAAADAAVALSELLSIPAALLLAWIVGGVEKLQAGPEHLRDRFA